VDTNVPSPRRRRKGHGLKAWPYVDIEGGDGVVYKPSGSIAEVPSHANDRSVSYKLVDIFDAGGLWDHRQDSRTFASWGRFEGDNGSDNAASAPWRWDDRDDGGALRGGELALEPAKLAAGYFDGFPSFSGTYTYNPHRGSPSGYSESTPTPTPPGGTVRVSKGIELSPADARVVQGDDEVNSDDWTYTFVDYTIRGRGTKQLSIGLVYKAHEGNGDKSFGDTCFEATGTIVLANYDQKISSITGTQSGSRTYWHRGESHYWQDFPSFGALSGVDVSFDKSGRSDLEVMKMRGTVKLTVQFE